MGWILLLRHPGRRSIHLMLSLVVVTIELPRILLCHPLGLMVLHVLLLAALHRGLSRRGMMVMVLRMSTALVVMLAIVTMMLVFTHIH